MKIVTVQAPTAKDFDQKVNAKELELKTLGTPPKFTQTHMAFDKDGVIMGYSAVMFYEG